MTQKSPLRQLAKEYYDGRIDRDYYLEQRRKLIDSIVSGNGKALNAPDSTVPGTFLAPKSDQLDSTDLSNALAQRQTIPPPDFGDIGRILQDKTHDTLPMGATFKQKSSDQREPTERSPYSNESGLPGTDLIKLEQPDATGDLIGHRRLRVVMWLLGGLAFVTLIVVAI